MNRSTENDPAVPVTTLPTGNHLIGRWVQLDLLSDAGLDELYPIVSDPAVSTHGYVMHHRPASLADARDLARSLFLAGQGNADGKGGGRSAYAIRLVADGDLGPAGTLVGTSALAEADLRNERIHLGSTLYGFDTDLTAVREVDRIVTNIGTPRVANLTLGERSGDG